MDVGVHENVPTLPAAAEPALIVNVAPAEMAEPVAVNAVMVWTSGSTAETVYERGDPSFTEAEAGAVTTGGRSTFVIETIDVCVRVQEFPSSAVHVSLKAWRVVT